MKEFLQHLKNNDFDGLNFFRNGDGDLEINGFDYKNPGEKVGGTELGDLYHIIVFPEDPPKMPELFDAILISPVHYVSRMIDDGFLGVVSKVTTNSRSVAEAMFQGMSKRVSEYIKDYEGIENDE